MKGLPGVAGGWGRSPSVSYSSTHGKAGEEASRQARITFVRGAGFTRLHRPHQPGQVETEPVYGRSEHRGTGTVKSKAAHAALCCSTLFAQTTSAPEGVKES